MISIHFAGIVDDVDVVRRAYTSYTDTNLHLIENEETEPNSIFMECGHERVTTLVVAVTDSYRKATIERERERDE